MTNLDGRRLWRFIKARHEGQYGPVSGRFLLTWGHWAIVLVHESCAGGEPEPEPLRPVSVSGAW
jgi:hypothetical protein